MSQSAYSLYTGLGMPGQFADDGHHEVMSFNAQEAIQFGMGVVRGATDTTCRLPSANIATIVFSLDFTNDNTIAMNVNGEAIDLVTFSVNNATTLALIVDAINDIDGVTAQSSGAHTIIVTSEDPQDSVIITNVVVTDDDVTTTATVAAGTAIIFSADFVALNKINLNVNAVPMAEVTFTSNQATTLAAIVTNINAMAGVAAVSIATPRAIVVTTVADATLAPTVASVAVTLGVSQATAIVSGSNTIVFAGNFTEDNTINLKVNASAITQVNFTTNNATTLAAVVTNITAKANVTAYGSGAHTIYVLGDANADPAAVTQVVVADGDPPATATITVSTTDIFLGISCQEHTVTQAYQTGITQYSIGQTVAVLSRGRVYVPVEQDVAVTDSVYLRDFVDGSKVRGAWRKDADTGAFAVTRARYMQAASAGNVTVLEVNLP